MDLATLIGMVMGFVLVAVAIVLGGSPAAFIDPPSILIVVGGTFCITMVNFSLKEVIQAQGVMMKAVSFKLTEAPKAALQMIELADEARKKGVLGLQDTVNQIQDNPFLQRGLNMIVDGMDPEEVERILKRDINETSQRHMKSVKVFKKAAEIAPAMGLIGTLVGLVQMLGNLDDPSSIGPAMAVALLTTFYGAVLANMVFSPLAGKLERNADAERMLRTIYMIGTTSIGKLENPRRLEMMINALLPPQQRVQYFD